MVEIVNKGGKNVFHMNSSEIPKHWHVNGGQRQEVGYFFVENRCIESFICQTKSTL